MPDFKIVGNANPIIGTEEFYSVSNPVAKTFPYTTVPKSPFDTPVIWTVHILEHGRWRKTKENDKKGDKVSYTFLQRSLGRKGIRIMATRGDQTARIDIDTHPAERPKVDSIDLLDKSGRKPAKPLSYGQTLKARVHCLHMEKRKIFVTLWEDDAKGAGHNKANEKNIIETRFGFVENGIADIDFLLRPTFAKIATRGGEEKDKIHEYYVTTSFDNEKLASKNVNVNELETSVAPFKRKVPVQQPVKNIPAQQPKAQSPTVPQTKPKGAINSVYITDAAGNTIKGTYRNKQIKVWINSSGLIGREIQLRLYDEDYWGNDLLADQKCTITNNIFSIAVALNEIPRSSGGDFGEGAEQEVFADIEVLETNKHTVSAIVDVDSTVFKSDPVSDSNSVFKVFQPEKKEEDKKDEKSTCERCNEDFKYDDIIEIFPAASKNKNLANDLIKEINSLRIKYEINTCLRKAHLINQFGSETGFNTLIEAIDGYSVTTLKNLFGYFKRHPNEAETYKGNLYEIAIRAYGLRKVDKEEDIVSCVLTPGGKCNDLGNENKEDGYTYIGRGLIQLTGKYNYSQINKDFIKAFPGQGDLVKEPELLEKPQFAAMSAFSYWINNKLNSKADLGYNSSNVDAITKIINKNLDESHYEKRRKTFTKAKEVYRLNECKNIANKDVESSSVTIRLIRKWQTEKSTIGEFTIDNSDIKGYILEEKGPDTTISGIERRVPIGTYNLVWHNGTKFKNVLKLYNSDVSINRAILIHSGNSAEATEGCLLPGSSKSEDWVSNSKDKLIEINDYVKSIGIENAKIIITQEYE